VATLDKVNNSNVPEGSGIYFKRGAVFRGGIRAKSGITYDAYGSGNKPQILGSIEANDQSGWQKDRVNVWIYRSPHFTVDVGNIIFNNGSAVGVKVYSDKDVKSDKEYWFDKKNKLIKLYSTKNPASRWSDIECALTLGLLYLENVSNVVAKDLDLRYTAGHAVSIKKSKNVVIKDLDISYIGGGNLYSLIGKDGVKRFGNGVEIYTSAQNILVEGNKIDEIYDAGITNQSYEETAHQNFLVELL